MPKKKLRLNKIIFFVLPIMMVFYVAFILIQQEKEIRSLKEREAHYVDRINEAKDEIERVRRKIETADEDDFIEKMARKQLKMIGSNEIIFIDIGKGN